MVTFAELKLVLRHAWLEYVRNQRPWLEMYLKQQGFKTPDNGRRPDAGLILGVMTMTAPQLLEVLPIFFKLSQGNPDAIIEALDLNFDPFKELAKPVVGQLPESTTPTAQSDSANGTPL
ncbi:MAG: DUF5331 domain-containing protein [Gloeomargarita sp. SKYB31]|nr:DUF5331 domain-containing protein [Gloeomargarita sp. SKYB31]